MFVENHAFEHFHDDKYYVCNYELNGELFCSVWFHGVILFWLRLWFVINQGVVSWFGRCRRLLVVRAVVLQKSVFRFVTFHSGIVFGCRSWQP